MEFRTIGLLGTRFTMEQPFYRGRLESKYGLKVLVPPEAERQAVPVDHLSQTGAWDHYLKSRQRYQEIIAGLISRGAREHHFRLYGNYAADSS